MASWNSWSWRWNPWLMAAKGYAVLLPDPRCPPATGKTSSSVAGELGAQRHSRI
ncbi:S9 family peptidase domain protein [Mycobacterium xenopi 4042]|uniref:S9 family peptidase domain protein n=1 Tax=Mycobacterium xenopi 4042 TaxID=1299334 RepID=X8ANM0_MYCXE|nr:S9 family peptidase domain protein [Mycobacterium xenopi 3993]EUA33199.1 S9 family peptidase domain protein [Mycobacterium xenopi 4042]